MLDPHLPPRIGPVVDRGLSRGAVTVAGEPLVDEFSPFVQEQIGWYVYLPDPRDGGVFYVGKGSGNRVFEHAHAALLADDETAQRGAAVAADR